MKSSGQYLLEHVFLAVVFVVSVAGFWTVYVGSDASPNPFHHLHVASNFMWLLLLFLQLRLIRLGSYQGHRTLGLAVVIVAPLLVATTALLSVHSAHKGLVSGKGDFLIVQNVMGTLELGFLIVAAFVLRKRRKLHGALLLSTAVLFLGIALFFALISFVPAFRIEGPETFHRFQSAAITGQAVCLLVGLLFYFRDFRNGWPYLLAGVFFLLNEAIRFFLAKQDGIEPLTEFVGGLSGPWTFVGAFVLLLALLAATGILGPGRSGRV